MTCFRRGDRIIAVSDLSPGRFGTYERQARNGYSWICLPGAGEQTDIFLWPDDQIVARPLPPAPNGRRHDVDRSSVYR